MKRKVGIVLAAALGLGWGAACVGQTTDARPSWVTVEPVLRLFSMTRDFERDPDQESIALGGWIRASATPFEGLSLELTPYTSQRLYGPDDRGGAGLLKPDQEGLTVLGEANVTLRAFDQHVRVYRQQLDTPMLNADDSRMIPITYEAAVWRWDAPVACEAGYVWGVKPKTATAFESMADAAGYDDARRGVVYGGAQGDVMTNLHVQLWEYYAGDLVNTVFGQVELTVPLDRDRRLVVAGQGADQRDVGDALAGDIRTGMFGGQLTAEQGPLSVYSAYTYTKEQADMFNPWSGYFGFTSIMEMDNNLAGEQCWLAGLALDLGSWSMPGLELSGLYAASWLPDNGSFSAPAQRETDLKLTWSGEGAWEGLSLIARAGWVLNAQEEGGQDVEDYRFIAQADIMKLFFTR